MSVGITGNLYQRIMQHKKGAFEGFTKKYSLSQLVYVERYYSVYDALKREKRLKRWNRNWKIDLIEKSNPEWRNLYSAQWNCQT